MGVHGAGAGIAGVAVAGAAEHCVTKLGGQQHIGMTHWVSYESAHTPCVENAPH